MTESTGYARPATAREALQLAAKRKDGFRFIAGGTDVLLNRFQGNESASLLIDLSGINEMKNVSVENDHLRIGALVTLHELGAHPAITTDFPALAEAAKSAASPVLRKTATLGGNILCENRCSFYNQSEWWREAVGYCLKCDGDVCIATGGKKKCFSRFVSDTAPVLIACGAHLVVQDMAGERKEILEGIYTGDGISPRRLAPASIVREIVLPLHEGIQCAFMKLRTRESMDFTSLTTAVSVSASGKVKIVVGGVDPQPVVLSGHIREIPSLIMKAVKKPRIIDNDIYSRTYRKEMIGVFLKRSFNKLQVADHVPVTGNLSAGQE